MSPDDPRHATSAGYVAGCRETCCRTAMNDYSRHLRTREYLYGPLVVPALGTKRRIQALMALGWSTRLLDAELGQKPTYTTAILYGSDELLRTTADRIAALYDRLSMRLPPQRTSRERQVATRSRNHATKQRWAPPLAWDDDEIDDPKARPKHRWEPKARLGVDEAVIQRVMAGEQLRTNKAERDEIVRRWVAGGGTRRAICERMGWHDDRYGKAS